MFGHRIHRAPMYDPEAVQPMRDELIAVGFEDLRTPEEVEKVLAETPKGTVFFMINSVCGCAAGAARPGVALALQNHVIPDRMATVFAGMEYEAVDAVRERHADHPPSSPSMALFKDGQLVHMFERHMIEGKMPEQVAEMITRVFDRHCSHPGPSIPVEQFSKLDFAKVCGSSIPRY